MKFRDNETKRYGIGRQRPRAGRKFQEVGARVQFLPHPVRRVDLEAGCTRGIVLLRPILRKCISLLLLLLLGNLLQPYRDLLVGELH